MSWLVQSLPEVARCPIGGVGLLVESEGPPIARCGGLVPADATPVSTGVLGTGRM